MERYSAASLFSSDHDEVMAQRQELEDLFHTSTPLEVTRICLTIPIRTGRIPAWASRFSNLRMLAVTSGQLYRIEHISECANLEVLDLSQNFIRDITPLRHNKRLRRIVLDANPVYTIPPCFEAEELQLVEELSLCGCLIENYWDVVTILRNLPKLAHLTFGVFVAGSGSKRKRGSAPRGGDGPGSSGVPGSSGSSTEGATGERVPSVEELLRDSVQQLQRQGYEPGETLQMEAIRAVMSIVRRRSAENNAQRQSQDQEEESSWSEAGTLESSGDALEGSDPVAMAAMTSSAYDDDSGDYSDEEEEEREEEEEEEEEEEAHTTITEPGASGVLEGTTRGALESEGNGGGAEEPETEEIDGDGIGAELEGGEQRSVDGSSDASDDSFGMIDAAMSHACPMCKLPGYREFIVCNLPQVEELDNTPVTEVWGFVCD